MHNAFLPFFPSSLELDWQNVALRDPEATSRAFATEYRLPIFSNQIKDLEKKWCRHDIG